MQYLVQPLSPHAASAPIRQGNSERIFTLVASHSDLALSSRGEGKQVQQHPWSEAANQQWQFVPNGDGSFRIRNLGDGLVLAVTGDLSSEKAPIHTQTWTGAPHQTCFLDEVHYGHFRVRFQANQKYLTVWGAKTETTSLVNAATWGGGSHQIWMLAEVRPASVKFSSTVTVFMDANYGGRSQSVGIGAFNMHQLTLGNDLISSVRVPPGMRVTLFEHSNFRGRKVTFTEDTSWVGDDFNDRASGLVVEKVARFYTEPGYGGDVICLGVGRYRLEQVGLLDNTISSLRVPQGMLITLYQHQGFTGNFLNFYEDCSDLREKNFDDTCTSIVIKEVGVVIPARVLRFGNSLQLKTSQGSWISANGGVGLQSAAGGDETFTVVRAGPSTDNSLLSFGDVVALRNGRGKHLSLAASGEITWGSGSIGDNEKWQVFRAGATESQTFAAIGDTIALCSVPYKRFLSGDPGTAASISPAAGFRITGEVPEHNATADAGRLSACAAEACGSDACGADLCGADACSGAACGVAASLVGACGVAATGIAFCGADVAGGGVCVAAACGAAAAGIAACGADACGAAACGAAACGAAACGAAACGAEACGADACAAAACGGAASAKGACAVNTCYTDAGGIDACGADLCAANLCAINACVADACVADACALDIIPIIPGI